MADYAGGEWGYSSYTGGGLNSRSAVGDDSHSMRSVRCTARPGLNSSAGGRGVTEYKKRARDLGATPPAYIEWVSLDPDSTPPVSPAVGPWGEIKIVGRWYPPIGERET